MRMGTMDVVMKVWGHGYGRRKNISFDPRHASQLYNHHGSEKVSEVKNGSFFWVKFP